MLLKKPDGVPPNDSAVENAQPPGGPFPIVGIGASAGGLEAFRELLRHLPSPLGMGLVYIQHLDPHHESILAEIFARETKIKVVQATEGIKVIPDHLYVIPPNTTMTIDHGELRLTRRTLPPGHHLPIDEFLRSLAEDWGSKGIAIVLSGASSDGALGLQAVKQSGGITFAQDASARHETMPQHAIKTGAVDFVLSPAEIAKELGRIIRHPYLRSASRAVPEIFSPDGEAAFGEALELLQKGKGTDFTAYRSTTLKRRMARRMSVRRTERIRDYLKILGEDREELESLFNEVLIKVTSFFRDPALYLALQEHVFPRLVEAKQGNEPIRVWVPACSTGEEAYSLAISLLEWRSAQNLNFGLQIFGTDLSQGAIDRARKAYFVENICMDVSPERLSHFFHKVDDHFQVNKAVRDLCVFARHDVTRDPPFSNMDLVSCRNLLIYMSAPLQSHVIQVLEYALRSSGFLVLGGSESLLVDSNRFTVTDKANRIFTKVTSSDEAAHHFQGGMSWTGRRRHEGVADLKSSDDAAMVEEADRVAFAREGHSGVLINASGSILQFRGETAGYLSPASGKASFDIFKMAREELRLPLRTALQTVAETARALHVSGVRVPEGAGYKVVSFDVLPLRLPGSDRHFLILFESAGTDELQPMHPAETGDSREIARLEQQLAATTEYLQSVIEELRATHEEVLSNNEELQSVNEELETSKEELQSGNEELLTVNEQLQASNVSLNQANADLSNLLASIGLPVVVLGPTLEIRMFTPTARAVFNFVPSDVGRQLGHIRSNLELDNLSELVTDCVRSGTARELEVRERSGGWYLMRVTPSRDPDTGAEGVILTLVDIFNRKQAEEQRERLLAQIQRESAQLALILEHIPSAVVVAEAPSGRVILANGNVERILGRGRLFVGSNIYQLEETRFGSDGGTYRREEWPIVRALEAGEVIKNERIDLLREDGTRCSIRASAAPVRDGAGAIALALFLFDEITEVESLRLRLAKSDKQAQLQRLETIGRLAGGVAHDFNNQLTVIIGYAQFVREDPELSIQFQDPMDTIVQAANRAAALTSQLLAFSRRQPIWPKVLDLNPSVAKTSGVLRRLIGEHITLKTKLASSPCLVKADVGQIEQIIMNLVTNARDAIDGQGIITVETASVEIPEGSEVPSGTYSIVAVSDTGKGMDEDTRLHLFEPFYTTKEFGKGTGLGLASVFGIVKQHGGEIRVESQPGKGTRFEVLLPCVDEATADPELSAGSEGVVGGSETILLVEDEPAVRLMTRRSLESLGYKVLEARNGREALQWHHDHQGVVSLVLTDVVMPEMHGAELVKHLRELQPGIAAVYMSGYPEDVMGKFGFMNQNIPFIQKPYKVADLAHALRQALQG